MNRLWGILLGLLLATSVASAQSVQQSGSVTPGHLPYWITSGVQGDGGTSADSPITSIGATGPFCSNSARQSAGAWIAVCLQAFANAPGQISIQNYGTASAQGLNFNINGTVIGIPTGGGTFIFGNGPFTVGDVPCFQTTAGVVQDCGLGLAAGVVTIGTWHGTPIAVAYGGTGATTQAGAQTALGLGTMALQNASNVAITGGTITGLPTPVNPSDAAIKSYVDASAAGLTVLPASALATAAVLPNTPTYANGSSGVGATLTAGTNSTLTVDGTVAALNTVVLVKNQASAFQNGIYTVTTAGSGSAAWVLTRATYFNTAGTMLAGSYTFITGGTANVNTSWALETTVATVGTTSATFNQFSVAGGSVNNVTITSGYGIAATGTCSSTNTVSCAIAAQLSDFTNSIASNVNMNNTANYFDGPSVAQGTVGIWFASGTVTLTDTTVAAFFCKLWDGTTVIASSVSEISSGSLSTSAALSGVLASPAANIKISCRDTSSAGGVMLANGSGAGKDSTVSAVRIQ